MAIMVLVNLTFKALGFSQWRKEVMFVINYHCSRCVVKQIYLVPGATCRVKREKCSNILSSLCYFFRWKADLFVCFFFFFFSLSHLSILIIGEFG